MTPTQELSISAVFTSMRVEAERHRTILIRVTLLFAALSTALVLLNLAGTFGLAVSVGLSLLLRTAYSGMVAALICLPGKSEAGRELWTAARPMLSQMIWATLIVGVLAGIGLILIVPCLYLLTIWAVVIPVIVVERVGVFESLSRSRELVRGNGWRVFGFLVCLFVVTLAAVLIGLAIARPFGTGMAGVMVANFLLNFVTYPLLLAGPAVLYNELARPDTDSAPESIDPLAPH